VILGGIERHDALSVDQRHERRLAADQELLEHHARTGGTERLLVEETPHRRPGFGGVAANLDAFAGGEPVRFDHEALRTGGIDLYPEYTGTGLNAVMKAQGVTETDPEKVRAMVKAFYEKEFNLTWLKPSGINNGYAIVVRPETAKEYNLKTLTDLGKASGKLKLGAGTEFVDRRDGIKGLKEVYGAEFAEFRQFAALRLRYDALTQKQVDVANGFSTDWQIAAEKFVALDDDKSLFPPYYLAPVVRPEIAANAKIVAILEQVDGALDNSIMQELNRQVEVDKKEPRQVAAEFLKAKGIVH
jgi:osmoprotectant transport system substrate-binding protein